MQVLMPDGELRETDEMHAVCEAFVTLKGKRKRVWSLSDNINEANCIVFNEDDRDVFIGNLGSERVKAVMEGVLVKGFLDLTALGMESVSGVSEIGDTPYIHEILGGAFWEEGAFGDSVKFEC